MTARFRSWYDEDKGHQYAYTAKNGHEWTLKSWQDRGFMLVIQATHPGGYQHTTKMDMAVYTNDTAFQNFFQDVFTHLTRELDAIGDPGLVRTSTRKTTHDPQ